MSKEIKIKITAISRDPIYIGTGGFTIGRVDNTIVRDPITRIPKIPGTSLAGTWRYYMALTLHSYFKEDFRLNRINRKNIEIEDLFENNPEEWVKIEGNKFAAIKCAGQDDAPNITLVEAEDSETGHCGQCMVCKTFGFSKQDKAQRGMAYFSDLNILLFPVYTRLGTRWITSKGILNSAGVKLEDIPEIKDCEVLICNGNDVGQDSINLGWLNFKTKYKTIKQERQDNSKKQEGQNKLTLNDVKEQIKHNLELDLEEKIILVSDNIIHQVINSNLETRTSVSIDPITGAAKEGALFTSEAIPRGTIFFGDIRIQEFTLEKGPDLNYVSQALKDSKKYFETLGIGGMTTRGFGRLKISDWSEKNES